MSGKAGKSHLANRGHSWRQGQPGASAVTIWRPSSWGSYSWPQPDPHCYSLFPSSPYFSLLLPHLHSDLPQDFNHPNLSFGEWWGSSIQHLQLPWWEWSLDVEQPNDKDNHYCYYDPCDLPSFLRTSPGTSNLACETKTLRPQRRTVLPMKHSQGLMEQNQEDSDPGIFTALTLILKSM